MDRTSILGDTIDYVKELLERINNLKEEEEVGVDSNHRSLNGISKEPKPSEVLVRNSPKVGFYCCCFYCLIFFFLLCYC